MSGAFPVTQFPTKATLTDAAIEALPLVLDGRACVRDSKLSQLMLMVGPRSKTFYLHATLHRRTHRVRLGPVAHHWRRRSTRPVPYDLAAPIPGRVGQGRQADYRPNPRSCAQRISRSAQAQHEVLGRSTQRHCCARDRMGGQAHRRARSSRSGNPISSRCRSEPRTGRPIACSFERPYEVFARCPWRRRRHVDSTCPRPSRRNRRGRRAGCRHP